jgi:nucleotide-binding universal stress UspA family protein
MARILVGYDGTDGADDALALASDLEGETGESIVLCALELPFLGPWEIASAGRHGAAAAGEEIAERRLDEVLERARSLRDGGRFEVRRSHLPAARALSDAAEAEGVDVVVVGSASRGPVGRVLLGSVGLTLLGSCPRPVAIAPAGWSRREERRIDLIGAAYDGSPEARAAVAAAAEQAAALGAGLRIVTVVQDEWTDGGGWSEELHRWAGELSGKVGVDHVLAAGAVETELLDQTLEVDLLALGTRSHGALRRTMLGSVARRLVERSPCPLLIVPRTAVEAVEPTADSAVGGGVEEVNERR